MTTKEWVKSEVVEGGLLGGEKAHGYVPDGSLLCGAEGEGGSWPYPFDGGCNMPDADDFDPDGPNACKRCSAAHRKLPE